MFSTYGFLFPVSTMNIIIGLRPFLLWQSRGKVAHAVALTVCLHFWAVHKFWVDFIFLFHLLGRLHFWGFPQFGVIFIFWLVFIYEFIVIFGAVSIALLGFSSLFRFSCFLVVLLFWVVFLSDCLRLLARHNFLGQNSAKRDQTGSYRTKLGRNGIGQTGLNGAKQDT